MNSNGHHEALDAIVVGGGLAGLAAAAYLARAGRSVIVLERSSHTGGRAITEERGGFYFNLGPHALYRGGPATSVLDDLGVDVRGKRAPQSGYAVRDGQLSKLPADPLSLLSTGLLSATAKLEFGRLFATIGFIKANAYADISLEEWLQQHTKHDEVRQLLRAFGRLALYANDPERISAGLAIRQLQGAKHGVLYLDRGWQTLVDGLQARAREAGARIETGARVSAIERDGSTNIVRLDDGQAFRAAAVVLATPPGVAADLLRDAGDEIRRWATATGPVRAATLDIGLSALPSAETRFVLGIDRPLYLSVHSGVGELAPPGGAMIHVAKYLGDETSDANTVERDLEDVLDLAQPRWRDVLVERRFLPNLTVVNALATAGTGGLPGRPAITTDIPGVYLAGDWAGGEGWLADASLASARLAASAALEAMPAAREAVAAGAT